jgi:hypothetical protein
MPATKILACPPSLLHKVGDMQIYKGTRILHDLEVSNPIKKEANQERGMFVSRTCMSCNIFSAVGIKKRHYSLRASINPFGCLDMTNPVHRSQNNGILLGGVDCRDFRALQAHFTPLAGPKHCNEVLDATTELA